MATTDRHAHNYAASTRVFAVTELAEMILGHLPILELVCMQRTCRRMRDIIETSKTSRRQLFWVPALTDTPHYENYQELQRFITFDNTRKMQPVFSFRMWQSTSSEPGDPIRLRFHETVKVVGEYDTTLFDFQEAKPLDLRRRIVVDEGGRAVEVKLKRANSMEMVVQLPRGTTLGELYDVLCEMSSRGQWADYVQTFIQ